MDAACRHEDTGDNVRNRSIMTPETEVSMSLMDVRVSASRGEAGDEWPDFNDAGPN